jgi:asparagine synthase (glutamine-hydrolysing)
MQQASCKTSPLALTIHWPDTPPDEVISARELCKHLDMTHEVLEIPLGNVLDELPLLGWISDEPVADPAIYSQFCIARVAARHVKVLLGGAGGDELFGGYGCYGLSRKYAAYNALPRPMQQGLRPFLPKRWMSDDSLDAIQGYSGSRFAWHSHTRDNLGVLQQAALSKLIPSSRNPFANIKDVFDRYREYDPANQQMIADFRTYLPEQILTMMDRSTMAASIEGRVPFLDNSLVDFAFSLSGSMKMGTPHEAKRLLKRAISQDVSQLVLQRKKAGMPSPFVSLLSEHVGTLRRIILARDSYVRSILPEEWLQSLTLNPEVARTNFRVLYAILTLELWHKLFIRNQAYSRPSMTAAELFEIPARAASA